MPGVTEIWYAFNQSIVPVTVVQRESDAEVVVPPKSGRAIGQAVPWCWHPRDFLHSHMEIQIPEIPVEGGRIYYVWQCRDVDGDFVRYSFEKKYRGVNGQDKTPAVALSETGGRRALVINEFGYVHLDKA